MAPASVGPPSRSKTRSFHDMVISGSGIVCVGAGAIQPSDSSWPGSSEIRLLANGNIDLDIELHPGRREAALRQRDRVPAAARRGRPAQRGGLLHRRQRRAGRGRAAAAQRAAAGRDPAAGPRRQLGVGGAGPARPDVLDRRDVPAGRPGAAVGDGHPAALAGRHPPGRPAAGRRRADRGVHPAGTVRAGPADDADHRRGPAPGRTRRGRARRRTAGRPGSGAPPRTSPSGIGCRRSCAGPR